MKKGFLSRKNQSLFDTNVQMKDVGMERLELVLDSYAIPESGTAKVRSRPTVNYFNSHMPSDVSQGFAVPTPKVPVLAAMNGPTTNGTGNIQQLQNGGMITVVDEDGDILIPPPPMVAPPPPPPQFIPPSPKFAPPSATFGDLEVPPELASLQPPPMHAPKPPTATQAMDIDLAALQPPPMAPPKPPSVVSSTGSTKSSLSISMPDSPDVPECPKFTPPPPPVVKQQPPMPQKTSKMPPPKPVRLSSMSSLEIGPASPSTPPAVPSSFNPQNAAKIYSIPKTTLLSGGIDRETKPKSILLLEDSSGDSVCVQTNGNGSVAPSPAQTPLPPAKPVRRASSSQQLEKDLQDLKNNLAVTLPCQPNSVPSNVTVTKPQTPHNVVPTPQKPSPTPSLNSPKLQKALASTAPQDTDQTKAGSPEPPRQYSPLLTKKLHNLKASESSGTRESVTSPLALLMAAKERDRRRSTLSRENSSKSTHSLELPPKTSIQPSEVKPNSFTVIPKSSSSSSLASQEKVPIEKPDISTQLSGPSQHHVPNVQAQIRTSPPKVQSTTCVTPTTSFSSPSKVETADNTTVLPSVIDEESGEDLCIPVLPPPPEFANSDSEDLDSPPTSSPPAPLSKVVVPPPPSSPAPKSVVPPPPSGPAPKLVVPTPPPGPAPKSVVPTPPTGSTPKSVVPTPPPGPAPKLVVPSVPSGTAPKSIVPPPPTGPAPKSVVPLVPGGTAPKSVVPSHSNPASKSALAPPPAPALKSTTVTPSAPAVKSVVPPPPPPPPSVELAAGILPVASGGPTVQAPKAAVAPASPSLQGELKARLAQQNKPKLPHNLPAAPTSANQATLLSILQRKMLEMDPKLSVPAKESENSTDEWGTAPDDEGPISIPSTPKTKAKTIIPHTQSQGLDMRELEAKVAKKKADATAPPKVSASNGPSKQPYGMTFTVRPGTKQPITLVSKGES